MKCNYTSTSFRVQTRKPKTKQSVKRDSRKGEWGQNRKCNRFHQENSSNKKHEKHYRSWWMVHNIIALYVPSWHKKELFSLPWVTPSVICPLNKQRQNQQILARFFKIEVFEVDINSNAICRDRYVKLGNISWNKER